MTVSPDALPPSAKPVNVVAAVLYAMFCVGRLVVGVGELINTDTLLVLDTALVSELDAVYVKVSVPH